MSEKNIGKVVQVIGPVLDIRFEDGKLPELLNAIEIQNGDKKITAEVAQHIGDNVARCISMNATDAGALTPWTPARPSRCRWATNA